MTAKNTNYNWNKYLHLAKNYFAELDDTDNEENETKVRCGISRAYYAVFHMCREYLKTQSIELWDYNGGSSHDKVISMIKELYQTSNDKLYNYIYKDLRLLKADRVKADYYDELISVFNYSPKAKKNMLEKVIKRADKILENITLLEQKK